ncbi:hypothetical protein HYH02_011026 [Chlamydomonas schloesseri]|uniref:Steroid 5-alpha reductase C-terminal domain-containing protein n=1 Tax=Chlamydomonas schloesseri TaxID=2026947 RepID=A0A835TGK6_9CHLO|nr:hypothetical protein HYH02_011026 [Chlamydomonas schloesseri]|eukprot:KAG2438330.1 hypothetical protein HYH02_011026 [Chlamydomonas schloesseri]
MKHQVALNLTRKLAQPSKEGGVTGLSLLARRSLLTSRRLGLLGRGGRGLLGGGATVGALMWQDAGAAIAHSLHTSSGLLSSSASSLFTGRLEMGLLGWLAVDVAINWAGWAVASAFKTEKFYDLLGSVSFLTLTAGSLVAGGASGARKFVVSGMVMAWAVRLGSYLVTRVMKTGGDARFDEVKHQPGKFFVYWTMQAVWVFVTLLPVLCINGGRSPVPLGPLDALGIAVYGLGMALEVTADWQKAAWKARPENKGRFIDEGLWSLSRHPNYCGEMMIWWGVFLTCAPGFGAAWQYVSVASPVVVMLLLRYVSGVPLLEEMGEKRWGSEPAFQEYKARTNLLLPLPRFKDTHVN